MWAGVTGGTLHHRHPAAGARANLPAHRVPAREGLTLNVPFFVVIVAVFPGRQDSDILLYFILMRFVCSQPLWSSQVTFMLFLYLL